MFDFKKLRVTSRCLGCVSVMTRVYLCAFMLFAAFKQKPEFGTAEIADVECRALLGGREAGWECPENSSYVCRAHLHPPDNVSQLQEVTQRYPEAGHAVQGLQVECP